MGKPPVDEHVFNLIKDKTNDINNAYTTSDIAEMYELDREIVADAMIAPSWDAYSSRYAAA